MRFHHVTFAATTAVYRISAPTALQTGTRQSFAPSSTCSPKSVPRYSVKESNCANGDVPSQRQTAAKTSREKSRASFYAEGMSAWAKHSEGRIAGVRTAVTQKSGTAVSSHMMRRLGDVQVSVGLTKRKPVGTSCVGGTLNLQLSFLPFGCELLHSNAIVSIWFYHMWALPSGAHAAVETFKTFTTGPVPGS